MPPSACVRIDDIVPATAAPGEIVKIVGNFPDPDYRNYCAVAIDSEGRVIPFDVIDVMPNTLTVTVAPYPSDVEPGMVMVGLGAGFDGDSIVADEWQAEGAWTWAADGPGVGSDVTFAPAPSGSPITGTFFGTLVGGDLCVTISGDCPAGTRFRIWPRAHHYGPPYIGYDCLIPCLQINNDSDEFDCALAICAAVEAAYLAHVPPIVIDCTVTTVGGGTKLTMSLPGLDIDWGMFNIEVLPPGACNVGGADCNPDCPCDLNGDGVVDFFDFIVIEKNFGAACIPGKPCCADLNGDGVIDILDIDLFLTNCPINPPGDCP